MKNSPVSFPKEKHSFEAAPPTKHIERMHRAREEKKELGIALSELWMGIAAQKMEDGHVDIGFACHDGTYTIDFAVHNLDVEDPDAMEKLGGKHPTSIPTDADGQAAAIAEYLVCSIRNYQEQNSYKFLGAGISQELVKLSPQAPARIWTELDVLPIVIRDEEGGSLHSARNIDAVQGVDELADSMARKCLV